MTRILIVDDHPENLYLLRMLLQGHGFEADEARHGAEALEKARRNPPDLVVSDLLMPVMDGYTLLRDWKRNAGLKSIPFVVYTATYTDPKDERFALDLGADAFIIKPAEPEEFLERIRAVLAKTEPGRPNIVANLPQVSDSAALKGYSEVLILKLEEKARQLERANRALQEDIERRVKAEEALRLRDRAIGAATQGIIIADAALPDLPIVYASPGFERLTGYAADEVVGRNCRFLQGKETDPVARAHLREAILRGESCRVELVNYRKNGTSFRNELSISPVRDADGRLTHFVGVQMDVTDRRLLEEQLRQAQKMEAVGLLAGGVAHDFNNLLTIIIGYSDLLSETLPPDMPGRELVAEIRKAGERSVGLTRQLLAFSRQQVLTPRVLDPNAVVHDTEKMLRRLIGEDVRLTTHLAPDLWTVRADPGQIEQVLLNLAVNARDAMPGGGRLTIETRNVELDEDYARSHPEARPGQYAMLAVADTGCGMTPEVKSRAFEPFFTTKGPGKGTGLGLATVYGIVKQSGGHIAIYTEVGAGTTFEVHLPRARPDAGPAKSAGSARTPPRGVETILLVEDDEAVRSLARLVLAECGYVVLEAANGDEAARLAASHTGKIDLLVTDVVMPGTGGRATATAVSELHPQVEILYVSGYTDDAVLRHGVLSEGVNFLQKPFSPIALAHKVREILDAR